MPVQACSKPPLSHALFWKLAITVQSMRILSASLEDQVTILYTVKLQTDYRYSELPEEGVA